MSHHVSAADDKQRIGALPYKTVEFKCLDENHSILMDIYSPSLPCIKKIISLPVVMFFHGGFLTAGDRTSFLPEWLIDRALSMGYAFISADYRLLIPNTGKEIIEDIQDAFKFVSQNTLPGRNYTFKLDGDRIAAAGNGAGGLCARLATIHATPRPKVLVDIYGIGIKSNTKALSNIDLKKATARFQPPPKHEGAKFKGLMYPYSDGLPTMVTQRHTDGITLRDKMKNEDNHRLHKQFFQFELGTYLDYYTGLHNPSISATLRDLLNKKDHPTDEDFKSVIPKDRHTWFPQFNIDTSWPPTIVIHETVDDSVPAHQSRHLYEIIKKATKSPVRLIEGKITEDHFDAISDFILEHL